MSTNLDAALKKDFSEYKKKLAALEKQNVSIDKRIAALNDKYAKVLELLNIPVKAKKGSKRARRGQSRILILGALKKATNPLKAYEIIEAISSSGQSLSNASVRQQLPKLVKEKVLKKNKDKTYSII